MTRSVQFALLAAAVAIGLVGRPATGLAQMSESDMVVRLDQLEADIRRLTGAVEELQFRNQQLEQTIRQMQGGGAQPQAGAPPRPGMAPAPPPVPGRRSDVFDPTQNPNAPGAPRVLGGMPGNPAVASVGQPPPVASAPPAGAPDSGVVGAPLDLGSMSGNSGATNGAMAPNMGQDVAPPPGRIPGAPGTEVATLPPSQTPRDAFDLAYGYVLHKDYALATQSFQDFLKKYPSDALAAEAQFWLGESFFQSKNYQSAAEAFVTMTKKYPTSQKQPDTLLRLGESLAALQQKDLACVTLAEVSKKYPHAAANVKAAIEREQKRVHC